MTDLQAASRAFDPRALATFTTGIVMVAPFSLSHEAAEWLLGHPVWTHEFADKATMDRLSKAALAQFPDFPVGKPNDWQRCADDLIARYGPTVSVKQGHDTRDRNPIETAIALLSRTPQ